MQAEEAQLQYMHLYKKMDAVYYQMAIAQKLTPSEMDIYYTICVLGGRLSTAGRLQSGIDQQADH